MKNLTILLLVIATQFSVTAQPNYQQAMGMAMQQFGQAETTEQLEAAAAQFSRIAEAENEEWLPSYYASMIYSIIVFRTADLAKKQAYAEKAQEMVEKALEIEPKESEIHTLQGMVYQAFLVVDPVKNGQLYSSKMNGAFQMAIKLNPDNPRPYYLQGVGILNTPEQFGGGKKAAKPLLKKAMKKFKAFVPLSSFHPDWGKEDCEKSLALCTE